VVKSELGEVRLQSGLDPLQTRLKFALLDLVDFAEPLALMGCYVSHRVHLVLVLLG
jgi:hypothetical protein